MTEEVERYEPGQVQRFSAEDRTAIKDTFGRDLTDAEFNVFIMAAESAGLSPVHKQIHAVKRGGKMSIQTGIDGFRLIAQRSGKYRGQLGPWWCGADGRWVDVWLDSHPPKAARVGVLRGDFTEPAYSVAHWSEYNQGQGMWQKMPANQLAKCAEALALRKAFPAELSGLYTDDEMDQADVLERGSYESSPTHPQAIDTTGATVPDGTDPAAELRALLPTLAGPAAKAFSSWTRHQGWTIPPDSAAIAVAMLAKVRELTGAAPAAQPEPAAPVDDGKAQRRFFAKAADLGVGEAVNDDASRHALIGWATDGAVSSAGTIGDHWPAIEDALVQLAEGRIDLVPQLDGTVTVQTAVEVPA